jgi:hypothetical protein
LALGAFSELREGTCDLHLLANGSWSPREAHADVQEKNGVYEKTVELKKTSLKAGTMLCSNN